jgi:hypothetical protein
MTINEVAQAALDAKEQMKAFRAEQKHTEAAEAEKQYRELADKVHQMFLQGKAAKANKRP